MGIHLELSGDLSAKECDAVTAMIAVLRGNAPAPAVVAPVKVPDAKPETAAVIPPPPVTETAAIIPPPPTEAAPLVDTTGDFKPPEVVPVGELDATGLPWDIRIHASTKTQKADKTWTAKRNVAADLVTQVTAELRANMAANGTPAPNDDGPVYTDPAQAFGGGAAIPPPPTESTVVPPPPTSTVPPPPTEENVNPAPDGGMAEFARIMRVVVEKQKGGSLSTEMASGIARQLGLADMRGLSTRLDLIPAFEALLP